MKTLMTFFLFFIFNAALSQTIDNTFRHDGSNIYNDAISRHANWVNTELKTILDTIFIEANTNLFDSLISLIGKTKIIIMSSDQITDYLNSHRSMVLHKMFPLGFKNGEFFISFSTNSVHFKKDTKIKYYEYSGSDTFYYKLKNNDFNFLRLDIYAF